MKLALALLLLSHLIEPASAQTGSKSAAPFVYDSTRHARGSNGAVTVYVDRRNGQFWIETGAGVPILFSQRNGMTSFTNVRVNGSTYTNNDLHSAQTPPYTTRMPSGAAQENGRGGVTFLTAIPSRDATLEVAQEFTPLIDNDYAFVRITTRLTNRAAVPVDAGMQMMQDLFIGGTDLVDVTVGGAGVPLERGWSGAAVPDVWEGTAAGRAVTVRGRIAGAGIDRPDHFIVGRWQYNGYLGAAAWDYQPSGLAMWDNAVLMQWNTRRLSPGETMTVTTDYGFLATAVLALQCSAETIGINATQDGYAPNPFAVRAHVLNTGLLPASNVVVAITLPAGAALSSGSAQDTIAFIAPGASGDATWMVLAQVVDSGAVLPFDIAIIDPARQAQTCTAPVTLPKLPVFAASIECPADIALSLTPDGSGYTPNPFDVVAQVRNTGTAVQTGLSVTLGIPPELSFASGGATAAVVPSTLLPGQTGTASWRCSAVPQQRDTLVRCSATLFTAHGAIDTCSSGIFLPAVTQAISCSDTYPTLRGTEFWTAFPYNDGSDQLTQRLFLSAPADATVRIARPLLGKVDVIPVRGGTVERFDVEPALMQTQYEQVERKGIHITSDAPIAVYSASLEPRHSEAGVVYPVTALGLQHVTAGYNFQMNGEHIVIVATQDGTTVTINPYSLTSTQRPPKTPFSVVLNTGETYAVRAGILGVFGGLSGTVVSADKPIAVYSGAMSGWIPDNTNDPYGFLNPHYEQMPSLDLLDTADPVYVAVPFAARRGGDTFKAVAAYDSTEVTVSGGAPFLLAQRGDREEFLLDAPAIVRGNKPFLLAQFSNSALWDDSMNEFGDGSMTVLVPPSRFAMCHQFPVGFLAPTEQQQNQVLSVQAGQWVEHRDSPLLAQSAFTVECWFRSDAQIVLASRRRTAQTTESDWAVTYDYSRQAVVVITSAGGGPDEFYSTPAGSVSAWQWNHVACVMNGPAGTLRVYVNGMPAIDTTFTPRLFQASTGLAFGGYYNNPNGAIGRGMFDELRYWNRERSGYEIRAAKDARLRPDDRAGLIGYWSFCGDFADSSGYGQLLIGRNIPDIVDDYDLADGLSCAIGMQAKSFANLVAENGVRVAVDGTALPDTAFHPVQGSIWRCAQVPLSTGDHRIETDDPRGVGVTAYGFDEHDAFSYPASMRIGKRSGVTATDADAAPGGFRIFLPSPHPVSGDAIVAFESAAGGHAELTVVDALGRVTATLVDADVAPGRTTVAMHAGGWAPGMYRLILRTADGIRSQRFMVVR